QHFVYDQDLWLQVRGNCKGKAHVHAAGIALHRSVDESLKQGELNNFVKLILDFSLGHAQNRAVEKYVFASRQLRVESGANFQQTGYSSFDSDFTQGWCGDARKDLQQRALPGSVPTDDPEHVALISVTISIFLFVAEFEQRIRQAAQFRGPTTDIISETFGTDGAQTI